MKTNLLAKTLLLLALALPSSTFGQASVLPDPTGILIKPIPAKLIVLTFDDAPASHATVVAPILKELGFGGTMYVCDFDSFRTREDWYLTYRQMQAMAQDGFEIGNHTMGHGGGLSNFLAMEDALLAHGCPKPTTVCWPVYAAAPTIYPDLAANGYTFGRGGYERPYRPTVDNPFDVPSFTIKDSVTVETFIKQAQQACQGRVVVYCFHGVPDMEHPGVSLEPATFKAMMQYLKDNNYQVIAMRDLAKYIDPVKAAKLAQTRGNVKAESPFETIKDDKPYVSVPITKPKPVPVAKTMSSPAKSLWSFAVPGATSVDIAGTSIGVYVPAGSDVKALAPTFTLPPLATAVPPSGTARDFTKPQTYTVTAQDGSTRIFTVSVVKGGEPTLFTWSNPVAGNWNDAAKWSGGAAPGGKGDGALSFDKIAKCALANNIKESFPLCRLALGDGGETLFLTGSSIAFTKQSVSGFPPVITVGKDRRRATFEMPVTLASNLHVQTASGNDPNSFITFKGLVSGTGGVVLNSYGEPESVRINSHDGHFGILQFENTNTYSGGTMANGGKILVMKPDGLGTGPVTLNDFATLGAHARIGNPVVINQGRLFDSICEGPITLNAVADFYGDCHIHGAMSGPSQPRARPWVGRSKPPKALQGRSILGSAIAGPASGSMSSARRPASIICRPRANAFRQPRLRCAGQNRQFPLARHRPDESRGNVSGKNDKRSFLSDSSCLPRLPSGRGFEEDFAVRTSAVSYSVETKLGEFSCYQTWKTWRWPAAGATPSRGRISRASIPIPGL